MDKLKNLGEKSNQQSMRQDMAQSSDMYRQISADDSIDPLQVEIQYPSSIPKNLDMNSFLHKTLDQPTSPDYATAKHNYKELSMTNPMPEKMLHENFVNEFEPVPNKVPNTYDDESSLKVVEKDKDDQTEELEHFDDGGIKGKNDHPNKSFNHPIVQADANAADF